jgi:hypothetical protein
LMPDGQPNEGGGIPLLIKQKRGAPKTLYKADSCMQHAAIQDAVARKTASRLHHFYKSRTAAPLRAGSAGIQVSNLEYKSDSSELAALRMAAEALHVLPPVEARSQREVMAQTVTDTLCVCVCVRHASYIALTPAQRTVGTPVMVSDKMT